MVVAYPLARACNWLWRILIILCEVEVVEQSDGGGFGSIKVSEAVSSLLRVKIGDFDRIRYSLLLDE